MAYDFSKLKGHIQETEEWLSRELSGIRTGRATVALLDSVRAEAYGARTPLTQLASVTAEDARTIRVVPWDKTVSKPIEKAINDADLGVSVVVDDTGLRVIFPDLTSERRTMLAKLVGERLEQARVTLRGHRADTLKELDAVEKEGGMSQDDLKRLKDETQKLIDAGGDALEALAKKKQEDIAQ
ncbi:MAG TPA: ribosome recycling factor [Candidatus Paceibacterota bacterium]|jgi:ribosome recycling factor